MTDFTGRVAVITGAANGMGEATARLFADAGATVVIADIDVERSHMVESEIRAGGGDAHAIPTDIRDPMHVQALTDAVATRWGRIDVLDNNAASLELTANDGDVLNLDPELLLDTLRGNLVGAFRVTKSLLPMMLEQGGGAIVNIASVSGMAGEPALTAYGVSKAGIIQLTRAISTQYAGRGVRCNAIAPAFVKTRNNEQYADPVFVDVYNRNMPTGHTADPIDIAQLVLFLGSDESRMVTGHVIAADGGLTDSSPITADFRELNQRQA